jgi:hypothetical protein
MGDYQIDWEETGLVVVSVVGYVLCGLMTKKGLITSVRSED